MYVEVYVDEEDILNDISTEHLVEELEKRGGSSPTNVDAVMKEALYFYLRDKDDVPSLVKSYVWYAIGRVI